VGIREKLTRTCFLARVSGAKDAKFRKEVSVRRVVSGPVVWYHPRDIRPVITHNAEVAR